MQETQETQIRYLGQEDPLKQEMVTISVFLSGKFHGQKSLVGYSPQGGKESDTTAHTHTHTHIWVLSLGIKSQNTGRLGATKYLCL